MNYRKFKNVSISETGLGTWQLGSADWGNIDEDHALGILQEYVSLGGNFIDTADVYGMGVSEKIIGKFLQTAEQPVYVATKLGRRQDDPNGWPQNFSYNFMKKHVEESLRNLGISELFLEQLHCIPCGELEKGLVFDNLRKLKDEGLIRYWGVSVETSEEALICMQQEGIASIQLIFNLFRQHVADELFEKAKEKDIALIIRVPLASGLLTGKFNEDTVFAVNDHRNYNSNGESFNAGETFSGIDFKTGVGLADDIFTHFPDDRKVQWAIRWILDHPQVTTVIPGASGITQVKGNMEASGLPSLPVSIHYALRNLYEQKIRANIRGHY